MAERENGQSAGRGKPSTAYTGQAAGWNELVEKLSDLARSMQDEKGLEHTLNAIVCRPRTPCPARMRRVGTSCRRIV